MTLASSASRLLLLATAVLAGASFAAAPLWAQTESSQPVAEQTGATQAGNPQGGAGQTGSAPATRAPVNGSPANVPPASGAPESAAQTQKAGQQQFNPRAQESPFGGTVVEDIVARVNDQVITRSDYDRAMRQLEEDGERQGWSQQELMERKRDLLRDLVDQQLLLSKGKELGITGETELVKRLDDIRKQNHLDSMEDLEKAAQQQGVSYEDFKQNIRNGIITQEVIRDEVARKIQLSPTDVQNYYQQHKDEFSQPESVRLSEILIPTPTGSDANGDLEKAKSEADEIYAKLKGGASFEDLAKADSKGSTAAQGGDLGEFRRGALAKQLEDATFSLQAGQFTPPIRTKQGYIILKVTQHTPGGTPDLKSIEPQVEEAAFMTRMQPQLRQYLTQLREQAYIDYKPGYVDTAATPNSVKPLYSAFTPAGSKKKAKVERTRYRPKKSYRLKQKAAGDAAASGKAAGASASGQQVASGLPPEKPGKKEKIRFGQAPREALPAATGASAAPEGTSAGAASGEAQVAANVSPDITGTAVAAQSNERARKTRFSDRARQPKAPKAKTADQIENENVEKVTPEELAAQKQQSSALGLAGDTAHAKKPPKAKGEKTRYADAAKERKQNESQPAQPQPQAPSPLATPETAPQPAPVSAQPSAPGSTQQP